MVIVILATFDCEPAPNFGQFVSAAITHRRVSAPKVEKRTKENQTSCLLLCCNLVISSPSSSTALGSSPQFPSSFVQHHQNPCHVLHCNAQDKGRSGWCHWSSSSSWSFKLSQWLKNLRQKLFNPINALQISQISWFMRFFAPPYWFSSSPLCPKHPWRNAHSTGVSCSSDVFHSSSSSSLRDNALDQVLARAQFVRFWIFIFFLNDNDISTFSLIDADADADVTPESVTPAYQRPLDVHFDHNHDNPLVLEYWRQMGADKYIGVFYSSGTVSPLGALTLPKL